MASYLDKTGLARFWADVKARLNAATIISNNLTVATSAWASNATYEDFPFRAAVAITGCTTSHRPDVTYSVADATSANFAPVAESYAGGIYIYAAEKPTATVTIPTVTLIKQI